MNKLKTIASAIALTMAFFSSATAKVSQDADIATTSVSEMACQYMQHTVTSTGLGPCIGLVSGRPWLCGASYIKIYKIRA